MELIKIRRSVREFTDEKISDDAFPCFWIHLDDFLHKILSRCIVKDTCYTKLGISCNTIDHKMPLGLSAGDIKIRRPEAQISDGEPSGFARRH